MVYSEALAERIRDALAGNRRITEKKMFGGVGFLLSGNMLVGVWQQSLIARLGPVQGTAALGEPHVKPFDVTGKPMKGWIMVGPDGLAEDRELRDWISLAESYVSQLPAK